MSLLPVGNDQRTRAGLTLVELVIVVLLIGILAAVAAPGMLDKAKSARESALRGDLAVVRDAIELYRSENGRLPGELGTGADLRRDLEPYLHRFPGNPFKDNHISIAVKSDGVPFAGTISGPFGWRYDNLSGQFIANSNGTASNGDAYWQY